MFSLALATCSRNSPLSLSRWHTTLPDGRFRAAAVTQQNQNPESFVAFQRDSSNPDRTLRVIYRQSPAWGTHSLATKSARRVLEPTEIPPHHISFNILCAHSLHHTTPDTENPILFQNSKFAVHSGAALSTSRIQCNNSAQKNVSHTTPKPRPCYRFSTGGY